MVGGVWQIAATQFSPKQPSLDSLGALSILIVLVSAGSSPLTLTLALLA